MKTADEVKILAQASVARAKEHKRIFKYLTYESGIKMLTGSNIQFTRADKLNDEFDCHISKVDFGVVSNTFASLASVSHTINSEERTAEVVDKHRNTISSFGICSLGISAYNSVLWDRYTKPDDVVANGICIELDLEAVINCLVKQQIKTPALKVDYFDDTNKLIPFKLWLGTESERFVFYQLLFGTKTKDIWAEEEEIRLIFTDTLAEEYLRFNLYKSCFKGVYLDADVTDKQREEVQKIIDDAKYKLKILPPTPIPHKTILRAIKIQ